MPNDAVSFLSGYPDRELLPERLVRGALSRAARGDAALSRPPAVAGEHTDEVLAEAGFAEADIARLRADGTIA